MIEGDLIVLGVGHTVQLIQQVGNQFAAQNGLFDDIIAVLQLDVGIQDTFGLDLQQGTHFTETVATTFLQSDAVFVIITGGLAVFVHQTQLNVQTTAGALFFQMVVDLQRAAGDTAGTGTNQDLTLLCLQSILGIEAANTQSITIQLLSHFRRPPFAAAPAVPRFFRGSSWRGPRH